MTFFKKIRYKLQSVLLKSKLKSGSGDFMICNPLRIVGSEHIFFGNRVFIREQIWIEAVNSNKEQGEVFISDGVYIGDYGHVSALKKIIIQENVLIANHVYITDHFHGYDRVDIPFKYQDLLIKNEVCIGEGSWLGDKVSILGASVGKYSIVGANSVVTKDIPDYSIAIGSPAKVIKEYCFNTNKWKNIAP